MTKIPAKQVKSIIKATFPKYRKRSVYIKQGESITFHDVNWSGGTKAEYQACTINGDSLDRKVDMGRAAPWNNPFEGKTIDIPPGMVVVEGGYFCGKERMLYITVNPVDMKLLT